MQTKYTGPPYVSCACDHCGATFTRPRSRAGRFCSRDCWRAFRQRGNATYACEHCGAAFVKTQIGAKRGRRYCGRLCANAARFTPLETRFWANVRKTNGCWLWTGNTAGPMRYGVIGTGGRGNKDYAHRVSYRWHVGPIPPRMMVCHACDTPLCVNPAHLFLATQAGNMADKVAKSRQTRGETNGGAKMTESQAREILAALPLPRGGQAAFARSFGVSHSTICDVINGRTWRHVSTHVKRY